VFLSSDNQLYLGLHQKKHGQQVKRDDPALLVRPHLQYFIQIQSSQYRRDRDLLECVQRKATKMIQGMEHLSYEDRLPELRLSRAEAGKQQTERCPDSTPSASKGEPQEGRGQIL